MRLYCHILGLGVLSISYSPILHSPFPVPHSQEDFRMISGRLQDEVRKTTGQCQEDFRMMSGRLQDDVRKTTRQHQVDIRVTPGRL